LRLVIEPLHEHYEVPHLATAGIRYRPDEGEEDRSTSVVGEDQIDFWCNAHAVEVDIVHPSPYEKLLWDICVNLGFCGGLVNGVPTHVSDLLPADGTIDAEAFAALAIQAEGGWDVDQARRRWSETLEAKFVEHLGSREVPVGALKEIQRRPFDEPEAA